MLVKEIRREVESTIPVPNLIGGKLFLRTSTSYNNYNKLLGKGATRTLSNTYHAPFLQKIVSNFNGTHTENTPSNKTEALTNAYIWSIGTLNQLSVTGSSTPIKFSKK